MNKKSAGRTRLIGLRFTQAEYEQVVEQSRQTTTLQLSEYLRRCIFDKPLTVKTRNQSLDELMQELITLRAELKLIGHNFNQAVRMLHAFSSATAVGEFIKTYEADREKLFAVIGNIQERTGTIADKWLQ